MELPDIDAVVIGCGVQGASAAHHLATELGMSVAIVDQFGIGGAASSASAAMVTQQTGHLVTTRLAKDSVARYQALVAAGWDIGFVECGYTTFASDGSSVKYITESASALDQAGVSHTLLEGDDAAELVQSVSGTFFSIEEEVEAALTVPSDGYVDPGKVVRAFLAHSGTGIVAVDGDVEAVQILVSPTAGVEGVRLATGEILNCSLVVNCGGAWAGVLGRQVGLHLPIRRSRRQMAIVRTEPRWPLAGILEHISHSDGEWYFRPSGEEVLVGTGNLRWLDDDVPMVRTPPPDEDVSRQIGQYLQRNTVAESVEVVRTWAGDRPITFGDPPARGDGDALEAGGTNVAVRDQFPMIGRHPTIRGYIDSCGWGEFGVTLAPVGGVLVAELAAGSPLSHDIAVLASTRFTRF